MTDSRITTTIPSLIHCINSIKSVGFDRNSHGSKQLAQLFTACLGFSSYIHRERQYMEDENCTTLPSRDKIPAMHALLTDRTIFKIFLSMLSSKCIDPDDILSNDGDKRGRSASFGHVKINAKPVQSTPLQNMMAKKQTQQQQQQQMSGRKRAMSSSSTEDHTPHKMMKVMRSPMQQGGEIIKGPIGNGPTMPALGGQMPMQSLLGINFSVLAAVIFSSVFQYLEQWPAVFIKLFAEDKFGQQSWVNDERCSIFVENLATALGCDSKFDKDKAELFVKNFDSYFAQNVNNSLLVDSGHDRPMKSDNNPTINGSNGIHDSDSSSDSGDEECMLEGTPTSIPIHRKEMALVTKSHTGDDSSSSGEEQSEDEIMMTGSSSNLNGFKVKQNSKGENHSESGSTSNLSTTMLSQSSQGLDDKLRNGISPIPSQSSQDLEPDRWWGSEAIQKERIQNRYFGANKIFAHELVAEALASRFAEKVKQNSGLLSTLPDFTSVPQVRGMVATKLEKWLQSPALSGLARALFSKLVGGLQNVDPPLPDDISTIQTILSMSLKANQFQTHVENVIEIARKIPTPAVCTQIVLHLFTEELKNSEDKKIKSSTDKTETLQMLKAVLQSVPRNLGHNAIASSIIALLSTENDACGNQWSQVDLLCGLLRNTVNLLPNKWYSGHLMVKFMLRIDDRSSRVGDDVIARIAFECILLMVPTAMADRSLMSHVPQDKKTIGELASALLEMKKMMLTWCLETFQVLDAKRSDQFKTKEPYNPDFSSILDGETRQSPRKANLKIMHCLLFLMQHDSEDFLHFLYPVSISHSATEELEVTKARSRICIQCGRDVDDDLIRIILQRTTCNGGNIGPVAAMELIELLLYFCRDGSEGSIQITDSDIVWDLYKLSEHVVDQSNEQIPRIACPALWWRVTAISLILCGKSPQIVGASMWKLHPTLRALMKMTISGKFRFPTVDCDHENREKMKAEDYHMREKESKIVETLFLTPEMRMSKKVDESMTGEEAASMRGTRTSARQRERQKKILQIEKEKEFARQQAEKLRIKHLLKEAQKSLMLWEQQSTARKPPKKSVLLLFSVSNLFHLANSFIVCTSPDYIIDTIGSTNRDGIERAYDWLIPIISSLPSVINRLPSSASCFLLLRAYGEGGGSNTSELLKLSSPLLTHVQKSLFGEHEAIGTKRASDLLFFDIADQDQDRRNCARRVLSEALGKIEAPEHNYPTSLKGEYIWLVTLLQTKYSDVIVKSVVPQLTSALFSERGNVLNAYIHALHHYENVRIKGDDENGSTGENFSSTLFRLLATRPRVCSAAIMRYPDLLDLMVRAVCTAFESLDQQHLEGESGEEIVMTINTGKDPSSQVHLTSLLLRAAIVLISNWTYDTRCTTHTEFEAIRKFLIRVDGDCRFDEGAASAKYASGGQAAVSLQEWVSLVKSSCGDISRESVICAPDKILPRLLLCCGLSEESFSLILERLDAIGSTSDAEEIFCEFLTSNAINEWNIGQTKRNTILKKLHGRVKTYTRFKGEKGDSTIFLTWLTKQCGEKRNGSLKSPPKKKNSESRKISIFNVLKKLHKDSDLPVLAYTQNEKQANNLIALGDILSHDVATAVSAPSFISQMHATLQSNDTSKVELMLEGLYCPQKTDVDESDVLALKIAKELLRLLNANENIQRIICRWVPLLSRTLDDEFFDLLFSGRSPESNISLVSHCIACWSSKEIRASQTWVIEQLRTRSESKYDTELFTMCFLQKSSYTRVGSTINFSNSSGLNLPFALIQIDAAEHITRLALIIAEKWSKAPSCQHENWLSEDWMNLILLVGGQGQEYLAKIMATMMVDEYQLSDWADDVLPRIMLGLYANFPTTMSLSDSNVREMLINASANLNNAWLTMSSPLDDQILDAIMNLRITILPTQQQLVIDFVKKYPLFAVKHTKALVRVLTDDAASKPSHEIERGRRSVQYPSLAAITNSKLKQVDIVHWGCCFSEPLWSAGLEILMAFPDKVIFSCGHLMGLLDVFNLYLLLFKMQIDVGNFRRAPTENATISRIRNKFVALVKNFSNLNYDAFADWVTSSKVGSHEVGDLLISCKIPIE